MNVLLSDKITVNSVVEAFLRKSYQLPLGVHFINIFGVRASTNLTDTFDDIVAILFRDDNDQWCLEKFEATTDPGKFYLSNPMSNMGTGILATGQYGNSHKIGLHQGKYKALVQCSPMKVFRDGNKDNKYDLSEIKTQIGVFGINIHRANEKMKSVRVDKWSAACQVLSDPKDFDQLMGRASTHEAVYGNIFNYTLLTEQEL